MAKAKPVATQGGFSTDKATQAAKAGKGVGQSAKVAAKAKVSQVQAACIVAAERIDNILTQGQRGLFKEMQWLSGQPQEGVEAFIGKIEVCKKTALDSIKRADYVEGDSGRVAMEKAKSCVSARYSPILRVAHGIIKGVPYANCTCFADMLAEVRADTPNGEHHKKTTPLTKQGFDAWSVKASRIVDLKHADGDSEDTQLQIARLEKMFRELVKVYAKVSEKVPTLRPLAELVGVASAKGAARRHLKVA